MKQTFDYYSVLFDLVLIAESENELMAYIKAWTTGFEEKGLKVNAGKTEVMRGSDEHILEKESGEFSCSIRA
jgi:hypothetical protein